MTRQEIIQAIDECAALTKSHRKKTMGLPRLKREILALPANDMRGMIRLLMIACAEAAPAGKNPPDGAARYWVNRHAWTLVSGMGPTSTRVRLEHIIASYRSRTRAPPPRVPVYLDAHAAVDASMIARMRSASRRADGQIALFGHGEIVPNTRFAVPPNTAITFYTPRNAFLRGVDMRAIAAPEVWGRCERPKGWTVWGPNSVDEHRIGQLSPGDIGHRGPVNQLGGTWCRDATPRRLSTILKPNMGIVHYVACRCLPESVPNADVIAFSAGQGQNEPGPEPFPLTDAQIEVLARQGGFPSEFSAAEYRFWSKTPLPPIP